MSEEHARWRYEIRAGDDRGDTNLRVCPDCGNPWCDLWAVTTDG